jgi:hypothetical protein
MTQFERRAGSEETLLALYDAVEAAEELDLEEQAHDEAFWSEVRVLYGLPSDEDDEPRDISGSSDEDLDDARRVTMPQAIGIIEHLLGGRPMRDGGQSVT